MIARLRGRLLSLSRRVSLERARRIALVLAILLAVFEFARRLDPHYPIQHWLFWVYVKFWLLCSFWAIACWSAGSFATRKLVADLPAREALVFGFAAGVYVFSVGTFVFGLLGLLGPVFALAWPTFLLAVGALPAAKRARAAFGHLQAVRRGFPRPRRLSTVVVGGFGIVCLAIVYFSILSPTNLAYDSAWYHLAIAEHYAAQGAVAKFPEGWAHGAYPQLSSLLYTWAFLFPGFGLFDRVLMSAHLEFTLFLATLASIPVLVRRIVPGARAGVSWAAFFLFPGLFIYDSSLTTAADHIAAFWAVPIFLALMRAYRALELRYCILLALMLSGALLTKYQTVALVLPVGVGVAVRAAFIGVRALAGKPQPERRWSWLRGLLGLGAAGLVFTTPHWLKNLIWYSDPLYPTLHGVFPSQPWHQDSAIVHETIWVPQKWVPHGTLSEKLSETLYALYTFSFEPHDWPQFHGQVPVFGSLFTLSLFVIPFLRGTRRLWGLVLCASGAVLTWYWTSHQDRYLQGQLPWMVVVVAATIVLLWQSGLVVRLAVCLLLGVQIAWGGDVPLIDSRGASPFEASARLLTRGYKKEYKERLRLDTDQYAAGQGLPKGSKFLIHEEHVHLGIRAASVQDAPGFQGLINYGRLESPAALHELVSKLGVTHLFWTTSYSRGWDTLAADLRFFEYATRYTRHRVVFGMHSRANVSPTAPQGPFDDRTLYLGCGATFQSGLYELRDLHVHEFSTDPSVAPPRPVYPPPRRPAAGSSELYAMAAEARFIVLERACHAEVDLHLAPFTREAGRAPREIWIRTKFE